MNGNQAIELLESQRPDLALLDLNLPGKDGLEILQYIFKKKLPTKTLVLTMYSDPKVVRKALKSGAAGYLLKDQDAGELTSAIREVMRGKTYLGKGLSEMVNSTKLMGRPSKETYQDTFPKIHYLTKREAEILNLIAQAMSNKEIAQELFISDQTVSVHRKNIMRKLGVSNTAGLVKIAYDNSLI